MTVVKKPSIETATGLRHSGTNQKNQSVLSGKPT